LGNNGHLFPFLIQRYDYLEIVNDGRMVVKYCGQRTGQNILLTGDQILIKLHLDSSVEERGFLIYFNAGPHGKYFFLISNEGGLGLMTSCRHTTPK